MGVRKHRRRRPPKVSIWPDVVRALSVLGRTLLLTALGPVGAAYTLCHYLTTSRRILIGQRLAEFRMLLRALRVLAHNYEEDLKTATQDEHVVERCFPDGVDTKHLFALFRGTAHRVVVEEIRAYLLAWLVGGLFGLSVFAWYLKVLVCKFIWPMTGSLQALWAASFWLVSLCAIVGLVGMLATIQACRRYVARGQWEISTQLMMELAKAYGYVSGIGFLSPEDRKRRMRVTLRQAADLLQREPVHLGSRDPGTRAKFQAAANDLRCVAELSIIQTKGIEAQLRSILTIAFWSAAMREYGMVLASPHFDVQTLPAPPTRSRLARALAWFFLPASCVMLIDHLLPGDWPAQVSHNWKMITFAWAVISVSRGYGFDLADLRDFIRMLFPYA